MRTLIVAVLAITLMVAMVSTAQAKDEFERGFRTELGAISARAAVGFGIGLVGGIVHGGPYYGPVCEPIYVERHVYVTPQPRWRPYQHHRYPRHFRPYHGPHERYPRAPQGHHRHFR